MSLFDFENIRNCAQFIPMNLNRFKFLMTGSPGSGKSSTIRRIHENLFIEDCSQSKWSVAVVREIYNQRVHIEIEEIDPSSFNEHESNTAINWPDVNAVFIVYDSTNRESFEEMKKLLLPVHRKISPECIISIVGNKADKSDKQVSWEEAEQFADEQGLSLFETSNKTGVNTEILISETIEALFDRRFQQNDSADVEMEQPLYQETTERPSSSDEQSTSQSRFNLFCWVPKIPFGRLFSN